MKKIAYRKFIVTTIVLLAIIPVFLLTGAFLLPCQYEDTFLGELKYKCERLKETKGKRIVLVGGSSVAFGTDSELLEQELKEYSVVDFGMYAALGTTVMLDLSEDKIRSGDIVILSPEQNEQTLTDYFNGEMMWQGVDGSFYLLQDLDRKKLDNMVGEFPYFAMEKWKYFLGKETPHPQGVYSRSSFNKFGDIVSKECEKNIMAEGYDKNQLIDFSQCYYDQAFIDRVNEYVDTVTKRGAVVWYRMPPMNAWAVQNQDALENYYNLLSQDLHCEIIGDPQKSILDPEWFYDTNFHLNNSGKTKNTYQLIRDIKAMLGDTSATNILLQDPPEFALKRSYEGNDEDADCFTYEMEEGRLWITGITDQGAQKTELIIPTVENGESVYGIRSETFLGNTKLQQITVQKNVSRLENAMFDGCTNLEKIILVEISPEECQVGQDLLQGTQAKVYVDSELVSYYKTNYAWSIYAKKILARN